VLQQRNWQLGAVRGAVVGTFLAAVALPRANDGWGRAGLVGTATWSLGRGLGRGERLLCWAERVGGGAARAREEQRVGQPGRGRSAFAGPRERGGLRALGCGGGGGKARGLRGRSRPQGGALAEWAAASCAGPAHAD
jgi:hypothetical protein